MKYNVCFYIFLSLFCLTDDVRAQMDVSAMRLHIDIEKNAYTRNHVLPIASRLRRKIERSLSANDKIAIDSMRTIYSSRLNDVRSMLLEKAKSSKEQLALNGLIKRDSIKLSMSERYPGLCIYLCYFQPSYDQASKEYMYQEVTSLKNQYILRSGSLTRKLSRLFEKRRHFDESLEVWFRQERRGTTVIIVDEHPPKEYFSSYLGFFLMDPWWEGIAF